MRAKRTLEQERAAQALSIVARIHKVHDYEYQADYRSLADGLPALVLSSGLAPALAFLATKGDARDKPHTELGGQIAGWVLERVFEEQLAGAAPNELLIQCLDSITQTDSTTYRQAEHEALEFVVWIKRFARAYIKARSEER